VIVLALLAACAVSVRLALRRPAVWLGTSLLTAMLPAGATRSWMAALGPLATVPPATWLMLAGSAALLLDERRAARRGTWLLLGTTGAVAVVSAGVVWLVHGQASTTALIVLWLVPMAGFVAVLAASTAQSTRDVWTAVRPSVSALAVAEALLAVAQRVAADGLVFEEFRTAAAVYGRTGRSAGTFDTPLDLAAFLTFALVVVVRGPNVWVRWTASAVVLAGVVCSGSRTGIIIAAAVVCLGVAVRGGRRLVDVVIAVGAAVAVAFVVSSAWAEPLFARFGARGERSSWARDLARDTGLQLIEQRPLTGSGLTYAYEYALANLPSSFEDAWLSLAIGAGLPVAALVAAVPVVGWLLPGRAAPLTRAAGAVPLIWGFSYSSYTATNTFGVLAWTFLGLSAAALLRDRAETGELVTAPRLTAGGASDTTARGTGAARAAR